MRRLWTGRSPAHGDRRSARRDGVHILAARETPNRHQSHYWSAGRAGGAPLLPRLSSSAHRSDSSGPGPDDGGAGKWGHYGREKRTSDVVTLWPAAGAMRPDVKWQFLGGMSFGGLRLLGAVGLAFDLQHDRSLNQSVEEGHRERTVGEIVSPFIEVHVGDHRRGALLIA